MRVLAGFVAAMVIGIPLGLLMAVSRTSTASVFPTFEVLRPIPPLAWVPIVDHLLADAGAVDRFVTFLGAFFTVVINVRRRRQVDRRALLPGGAVDGRVAVGHLPPHRAAGTLPSIVVGSSVGMGITWNVVVAAEMISGGGGSGVRRRPRLLHLELVRRRLVRADRRRHDQHRHRRLRLQRSARARSAAWRRHGCRNV